MPTAGAMVTIFAIPILALFVTAVASLLAGIPMDEITRDPLATVDAHPLLGIQSVVGVAILWLAASICYFAYAVLRTREGRTRVGTFLLWSGVMSTFLAIDDQFQIHDGLIPMYLGSRERFILMAYAAIGLLYLLAFFRTILLTEWMLLGLAFVLMAGSIGLDYVSGAAYAAVGGEWTGISNVSIFFEDGVKLLGIVAWAAYFVRLCFMSVVAGKVPGALGQAAGQGSSRS